MKIGILGGGQLARMLALAGHPLGIRTFCLDSNPEACASDVTVVKTASFEDQAALQEFISEVDIVTFETENIPLECAKWVKEYKPLYPSLEALQISQDRLYEKNFFKSLSIPTPQFRAVNNLADLKTAVADLGLPAVLKTRRMGYDGKGQIIIYELTELEAAWSKLCTGAMAIGSFILEKFIPFQFELSLIAVRNGVGEIHYYPITQNYHRQGILRWSEAPLSNEPLSKLAQSHMEQVLQQLAYVGVLTIEFFYDGQQLIANEMAPRVHNSGHWTIEGAQTSQFENHLRAILQWPLGSTQVLGSSFMLNCIGQIPAPQNFLSIPGVHFHTYNKIPRDGRKLGHITLNETDPRLYAVNKETLINNF